MHQPWDEYWIQGWGPDPDLWRDKMGMLEFEERKAMFNPYDAKPHPVDFKCQCKQCVQKTTLTMEDRAFLYSIGVAWSKRHVQAAGSERPRLPKPQAGKTGRAQEAQDLRKA